MVNVAKFGTPWEIHEVAGIEIYVKRDDLCCDIEGLGYSKVRGIEATILSYPGIPVGIQDASIHSLLGWGTSYLCKAHGETCYVFYPVYASEGSLDSHTLRPYQQHAKDFGAILVPQKAGRARVLWYQARRILDDITGGTGIMFPAGAGTPESIDATAREVSEYTPHRLKRGTWILSISTGSISAGILKGLEKFQENIKFIMYVCGSRSSKLTHKRLIDRCGYSPKNIVFIDEGWDHNDVEIGQVPFPASRYFEAKAWNWLVKNIQSFPFREPIIFWNIGS